MTTGFQRKLQHGMGGENLIRRWILRRGNTVLPVYETEGNDGKGPRLFVPDGELVAPDMLVIQKDKTHWIEAKRKTVFSWHRKTQRWTTGIDRYHYQHYLEVEKAVAWPVWLLFLHECDTPAKYDRDAGCPQECPTGLFGGGLRFLSQNVNHEHSNHGSSGMVYWAHRDLKRLATLGELLTP